MTFFNHHFECKICGKNRHGSEIDVATTGYEFPGGGSIKVNVNHCYDNKECQKKAKQKADLEISKIKLRRKERRLN